ncbi:MAG: hypothetical protein P3B98_06040 [Gemmatimonadota bacterium]|nr:hypothetical protein [Gemmatimonadota bacterium]
MSRFLIRPLARCAALVIAVSLWPSTAHAIPPFARKYGVSCSMCHQPVPRLTPFGENFAANGFEMAVGEAPRDTIATGDPLLRLPRTLPLGVRVEMYQRLLADRAAGEATFDQQNPWIVKLLSGGQIADKVSYYMYFLATERGEVAGLEDAYVQFTDLGGSGVNLLMGQFQVSDPLFKRELRLSYEDYQPYRVRVGKTRADLTYDRGMMAMWSPREGTDLVLQMVTGQGLTAANDARQYDRDNQQNWALRASQSLGPIRLGLFGYTGREGADGSSSTMRVFGPDATIDIGSVGELNIQYLRRWDSDPFLGSCSIATPCAGSRIRPFSTTVNSTLAEVTLWPSGPASRWYVTGLYNAIDADAPVVSLRLGEQGDAPPYLTAFRTGSVGLHYVLRRNVRLLGEGSWDFERERARLITGFTLAF